MHAHIFLYSTTTGRPRVCILWRVGVPCPVSTAWYTPVWQHTLQSSTKFHCYKL